MSGAMRGNMMEERKRLSWESGGKRNVNARLGMVPTPLLL